MKSGAKSSGVKKYSAKKSSLRRAATGAAVATPVAAAGVVLLARSALQRWGRSELAKEELGGLDDVREVVVRAPDGAEIAAVIAGDSNDEGSLFVLAHGWTNDRRVWAPVARRLVEAGHKVVYYDQRGHGFSSVGSSGYTLEALASDMLAVLEHFKARNTVVAGHSMGGMTAQALATLHPEEVRDRVSAMVLVATTCEGKGVGRYPFAERYGAKVIAHPSLERAMGIPSIGPFLVRRVVGREACRAHLDSMCEMFVGTSPDARVGFLESIMAMNLADDLPKLDMPVTVVAGERDNLLPVARSRKIASLIPGSRLVEIRHAGHMLPVEVPERVASILIESANPTESSNLIETANSPSTTDESTLTDSRPKDEAPAKSRTKERSAV